MAMLLRTMFRVIASRRRSNGTAWRSTPDSAGPNTEEKSAIVAAEATATMVVRFPVASAHASSSATAARPASHSSISALRLYVSAISPLGSFARSWAMPTTVATSAASTAERVAARTASGSARDVISLATSDSAWLTQIRVKLRLITSCPGA